MDTNNEHNRNPENDPSLKGIGGLLSRRAKSIDSTPRPGFREALLARLREARKAPSMSKISLAALFSSAAVRFAAAGTTVLVVLVIAVLVFQPYFGVKVAYAADEFTLTPETSDALGVD